MNIQKDSPFDAVFSLPGSQLALLAIAIFVFIFGSHAVLYMHAKRVGKRYTYFGNPFSAFMHFNTREWFLLLIVNATGFATVLWAINLA